MSTNARQLLAANSREFRSVSPDTLVYDAIELMAQVHSGALLVTEKDRIVGIISERDYTRKIILKQRSSRETPVRTIMTSKIIYARPEQSVEECLAIMSKNNIRHLPVIEVGKAIGMLSIIDVTQKIISEKDFLIEQLENYIAGAG